MKSILALVVGILICPISYGWNPPVVSIDQFKPGTNWEWSYVESQGTRSFRRATVQEVHENIISMLVEHITSNGFRPFQKFTVDIESCYSRYTRQSSDFYLDTWSWWNDAWKYYGKNYNTYAFDHFFNCQKNVELSRGELIVEKTVVDPNLGSIKIYSFEGGLYPAPLPWRISEPAALAGLTYKETLQDNNGEVYEQMLTKYQP